MGESMIPVSSLTKIFLAAGASSTLVVLWIWRHLSNLDYEFEISEQQDQIDSQLLEKVAEIYIRINEKEGLAETDGGYDKESLIDILRTERTEQTISTMSDLCGQCEMADVYNEVMRNAYRKALAHFVFVAIGTYLIPLVISLSVGTQSSQLAFNLAISGIGILTAPALYSGIREIIRGYQYEEEIKKCIAAI
ncbi:hypothetical protein [Halobellus ruber]|uniref:Uncharacterized protein n=1 Tax=Halobellus ruber TaxID=2761102 RepID=A0A7J9SJ75_9EURY|nr:hypothetical protein [Halobellus ruber]MBB6645061.1 hypothetical protein [Halobellus ruber]